MILDRDSFADDIDVACVVGSADDKQLVLPLSSLVCARVECCLVLIATFGDLGVEIEALLGQELVPELQVNDRGKTLMLLYDLEVRTVQKLLVGVVIWIHELPLSFGLLSV